MEKELLAIITGLGIDLDGDIIIMSKYPVVSKRPTKVYINVMKGVVEEVKDNTDQDKPYNIKLSDAGFTGETTHKIDDTFDPEEHGCRKTVCDIHFACATITYGDVNCPKCIGGVV